VPQIEVTFDIDANGILKVTAQDKATGRSQNITITASSGLDDSEVERMRKEAEAHADEDLRRKERVEARNNADNTAYAAEKALSDLGDKVPDDVKTRVEEKVAEVRKVLEDDEADTETLKRVTEELSQEVQQIGAAAYQQPEGPAAGAGPSETEEPTDEENGPDDEDVVEGEFRNA
jgi:molecular chaperone DnaK